MATGTPEMARALGQSRRQLLSFARAVEHLAGFAHGVIDFSTGDRVAIGAQITVTLADGPTLSLAALERQVERLENGIWIRRGDA